MQKLQYLFANTSVGRIFRTYRAYLQLPEQLIILLTNQRSGSTWLFDALRCHPSIEMKPEANTHAALGLWSFRRYPADLSNTCDSNFVVEVVPGRHERIPQFALADKIAQLARTTYLQPFAIEKVHPNFFNYDSQLFLKRLDSLRKKTNVKIIYHVRDPRTSMISAIRYKERRPSWGYWFTLDTLAHRKQRIFSMIFETARDFPGLVTSYTDLFDVPEKVLTNIYEYLWEDKRGNREELDRAIANDTVLITSREKRSSTAFLGENPGKTLEIDDEYTSFFEKYHQETEMCYQSFNALLSLNS
jgi:hypothetical protein